jgi:hypothetical protein
MPAGQANEPARQKPVTIVGGGIAGLVAAITCAEAGHPARILEGHKELGGRARATESPYVANFGPRALYEGRANWRWLAERELLPAMAKPSARQTRFLYEGKMRRMPPLALLRPLAARRRSAPVESDFHSWAAACWGENAATMLSRWAGVFTFDPDPGRLSAAFVWERMQSIYMPPAVHFVIGGWGKLVEALGHRARELGVAIETAAQVAPPLEPPMILATELQEARRLLGEEGLSWESPRAALLDVVLRSRRGDPGAVIDLDGGVLIDRYSAFDAGLAPEGEDLIQAHVGLLPEAPVESGVETIEAVLDTCFVGWRDRTRWHRRQISEGRTGALDLPGKTWRERPAIDRGDGVFLAGDMVAASGILSEVSFESAQTAARLACEWRTR